MTGIKPPPFHAGTYSCPCCGQVAHTVSEERVPERLRLCDPKDETRAPGSRWRRYEPCGHTVEAANAVINVVFPSSPTAPRLDEIDPCRLGKHRPAYLAAGGVACGYCGAPL